MTLIELFGSAGLVSALVSAGVSFLSQRAHRRHTHSLSMDMALVKASVDTLQARGERIHDRRLEKMEEAYVRLLNVLRDLKYFRRDLVRFRAVQERDLDGLSSAGARFFRGVEDYEHLYLPKTAHTVFAAKSNWYEFVATAGGEGATAELLRVSRLLMRALAGVAEVMQHDIRRLAGTDQEEFEAPLDAIRSGLFGPSESDEEVGEQTGRFSVLPGASTERVETEGPSVRERIENGHESISHVTPSTPPEFSGDS